MICHEENGRTCHDKDSVHEIESGLYLDEVWASVMKCDACGDVWTILQDEEVDSIQYRDGNILHLGEEQ